MHPLSRPERICHCGQGIVDVTASMRVERDAASFDSPDSVGFSPKAWNSVHDDPDR